MASSSAAEPPSKRPTADERDGLPVEVFVHTLGFCADAAHGRVASASRSCMAAVKAYACSRTTLFCSTTRKRGQGGRPSGKYCRPCPITDSAITGGWLAGASLTHVDFSGARALTDAAISALTDCPIKILNLSGAGRITLDSFVRSGYIDRMHPLLSGREEVSLDDTFCTMLVRPVRHNRRRFETNVRHFTTGCVTNLRATPSGAA